MTRLTVVRSGMPAPDPAPGETVLTYDQFRAELRTGGLMKRLFRAGESRLLVHRVSSAGRPVATALALHAVSRGSVAIEDADGRRREISLGVLGRWIAELALEPLRVRNVVAGITREVARLEAIVGEPRTITDIDLSASPLYLRTDLSFGIRAGGSVGHTAGVLNNLEHFTGPPVLITTDDIPTLDPRIEVVTVAPSDAYWNFRELPAFVLNAPFERVVRRVADERRVSFLYQRYSLSNYTGVAVSRALGVPLVLEFNGSEVWVSRHWGRPLKYDALSTRIETLNLRAADLIVVVSEPIAADLRRMGIAAERVLVNPNGVDPTMYRPDVDGEKVRRAYRLDGRFVIGFIGTFGPWHGAEVLARAYVQLRQRHPELRDAVRLLMIGDGARTAATRAILVSGGALDATAFTGLVPQDDGPEHLAAADLLVSPHVTNPDGTPFFGSPTKLFEYMAMGRPIVASDLEQIGQTLEHGRTAWLVPPGDVEALADAMARLASDAAARRALGAAARQQAVARHTWREHTRRIVDRIADLYSVRLRDRLAGDVIAPRR